jgi:heme-degrading monooxygenase HmoA
MYARIFNASVMSGKMDEFVAQLQQEQLATFADQPGFRGVLILGDQRTRQVIIVSFWRSRRDEEASAHSGTREQALITAMPYIGLSGTGASFDVLYQAWPRDTAT